MRCRYKETSYISGKYVETYVYPVFGPVKGRRRKFLPTRDVQAKLNAENSRRRLGRLIACNFTRADSLVTLTYRPGEEPETDGACLKDWYNFRRRLDRAREKAGLPPVKAICIPEKGAKGGRYHMHVVMSGGLDAGKLRDVWGKGFVRIDPLEFDDYGMQGLGEYLHKCPILKKTYLRAGELSEPDVVEREGKISRRRVVELYGLTDCPEEFEKQYEGVRVVSAESFYNTFNTQFYLRVCGVREAASGGGRTVHGRTGTRESRFAGSA